MVKCNEINKVINQLKLTFNNCRKVEGKDLVLLMELIDAINKCNSSGEDYDTLVSHSYLGPIDVTYPPNTFHSFSLMVTEGTITYQDLVLTKGSVKNIEFTNLNKTPISFKVNEGGKVLFEYLTTQENG